MVFIKVGPVTSVMSSTMTGVQAGGKEVLVANVNGKFYAIGNKCTHMGCKVSGGKMLVENVICPCHGSTFDLKTGAVVRGPAKNPEPSFPVKIEKDVIWVDVENHDEN